MKPPKKGFFKGVLGSRLGLSLFRSDSVLASWPALSAQSPEILFGLGAVLSPAGDCVWLGPQPTATRRRMSPSTRPSPKCPKFRVKKDQRGQSTVHDLSKVGIRSELYR